MSETPAPQALYPDEDGVLTPHDVGVVQQTNEEYHSGPGISKSHLDAIASKSPRHYWDKYINPDREPHKDTAATIMGSAVHAAILEPDDFTRQVVASPGFDRRTKNGKAESLAFEAEHAGKIVLDPDDYKVCLSMRDAVYNHPVAGGLLTGGRAEQSFFAIDPGTGELIKCRTDYIHDSGAMIVDLKTTDDASPSGFGKSAANYRYPIQTAWYNRVLKTQYGEHPEDWVFLAVEKERPFAIGVYVIDRNDTLRAEVAANRDFMRIFEHRKSGYWPDYGVEPQPLAMPAWWKP